MANTKKLLRRYSQDPSQQRAKRLTSAYSQLGAKGRQRVQRQAGNILKPKQATRLSTQAKRYLPKQPQPGGSGSPGGGGGAPKGPDPYAAYGGGPSYDQPSPQDRPLPFDELAETDSARLNRNYQTTLAALQTRQAQITQQYGIDDPSNPFSQAKLLQRTYEQAQSGTQNAYASRGLLYSGALNRAKRSDRFDYEADYDLMRREYEQELQELERQRVEEGQMLEQGRSDLDRERLDRALSERPYADEAPQAADSPYDYAAPKKPAPGGGKAPAKPKLPTKPKKPTLLDQIRRVDTPGKVTKKEQKIIRQLPKKKRQRGRKVARRS